MQIQMQMILQEKRRRWFLPEFGNQLISLLVATTTQHQFKASTKQERKREEQT